MRIDAATIRTRLKPLADEAVAAQAQRYFKSGPGEYGEGDRFLGIRVPVLRKIAREHRAAPASAAFALLRSPIHEERALALLLLVDRYRRGTPRERERIYARYLEHVPKHVNNWDLVDTSAHEIVGAHLEDRDRGTLYELARAPSLWSRRVAMIATFWYIRRDGFDDALAIAELLLDDDEDLIHKAAGWMVREVGNRDPAAAKRFLRRHCKRMPRTMLRYAIEKLPADERAAYMAPGRRAQSGKGPPR